MSASKHWEQNKDATVYVGNIDERFTQELLSELMTQVGPVRQVHMPQDRVSQTHQGYGFVEFDTPQSADYAAKVLNSIRVWGKPIRVNKASADKQKSVDIGAELFISNLDPQVDEKILYDTFSQFGGILRQPNIVRDDNNISKGYGFVSFDSFEASDTALESMRGQYILGRPVTVEYAYKKDGKGERHGDEAERKLAAEGKKHNMVPERQTLPAGYHMNGNVGPPAATPNPAIPVGFPDPLPAPPGAGMPPINPAMMPYGLPATPMGQGRGVPSLAAFGAAGRVLPSAPSSLPARPPPSTSGFGAPPGFRGPIGPAGVVPPGPGYPGGMAPPPAFAPNGMPAPPPGFAPPGFAPPVVPPPNGFGHHR